MTDGRPLDLLSDTEREGLRECDQPGWTSPMLATLTDARFSDPDWVFERKLDGERALAFRRDGRSRLMTRNGKEIDANYPEIADAFDRQSGTFIVDGEIVAFDGKLTSFSRLQQRMQVSDPDEARNSGVRVYMYLFDILYLDGMALDGLPLRVRKKLLRAAIDFDDPLRFARHRNRDGEAFYREACSKGWEGLIAKDAKSRYEHNRQPGTRHRRIHGAEIQPQGFRRAAGGLLRRR